MTINTRVSKLQQMDYPSSWHLALQECNPNDKVYITTERPANTMSIAELEQVIADRKADAVIAKATAQLFEALDILKEYGAEIDVTTIGISRPD